MIRHRRRHLPPNPKSLNDLEEIAERYRATLTGERFLLFDSYDNGKTKNCILVFATRKNLELLAKSHIWVLDEVFKVSLNIFTQVFTILGTVKL